jgi:hypothetical protein
LIDEVLARTHARSRRDSRVEGWFALDCGEAAP